MPPTGESGCLALLSLTRILALSCLLTVIFLGVASLRRHTEIFVVHRVNYGPGLIGSEGFPGHRRFRTKISKSWTMGHYILNFNFELIIFCVFY